MNRHKFHKERREHLLPNQPSKSGKVTRITELRARRRARYVRTGLLIAAALVLLVLYAMGAYGKPMALLGDLLESASISLQPGAGFPTKTGISDPLHIESLAGGFVELGSSDVVVVSSAGNQLRTIAHTYARPAITAGNTRFALYSRSGYDLRVESRTRTLYTHVFSQPILLAEMSSGGSLAVVTDSNRYLAELTVYNIAFEPVYTWYPTEKEGTPSRVAFAADGKRMAVACLKSEEGSLSTNIHLLDTRKNEIEVSIPVVGSAALQLRWLDSRSLLVIFQNKAAVYDMNTGEETAVYSYGGDQLASASVSGQNTALLLGPDLDKLSARLVILDAKMQEKAVQTVAAPNTGVVCTRSGAYVLKSHSVMAYNLAGEQLWEMELDTQPLAVLDTQKLLVFESGWVRQLKKPGTQAEAD